VTVKRQMVSPAIRRKEGRGRPATPFLRERILQSAAELFAEREFELVLIDEVAARAGVGKGSVYRQFRSKEELYAAAVIGGFAELQREIRVALAGCNSVREQIATIVRRALIFFRSRRQFFAMLRDPKALPPSQERQYRDQRNELSRLISGVLDEGVKHGAVKPGMATLPVTCRSVGNVASRSAHSAAERTSFHRMAGRSTAPVSSSSTAPCI